MKTAKPYTAILCLSLSMTAYAEIVEIPPEEMTEAYIKDTTIIIPSKTEKVAKNKKKILIKVSPIEDDYEDADALPTDPELITYADNVDNKDYTAQQQYLLDVQASNPNIDTTYDPDRHANDEYLRGILGLVSGTPIDYDNLQFPELGLIPSENGNIVTGTGQFQLSIQNNGQYPTDSSTTPNGEIGVDITPSTINIQVNIPSGP